LISGNEKIDEFIQEMQLENFSSHITLFEWIPYNQFSDIKQISKDNTTTLHSAVWINGLLKYSYYEKK
jgi:hypothetical protein